MGNFRNDIRIKWSNWWPVILFIAVAVLIRICTTSGESFYLLAGSDGPYVPLQVKYLFERGHLALPDMPLLFTLVASLAKLLFFFQTGSENECILWATRIIDVIIPPLAAIPFFLIVRQLNDERSGNRWINYLLVAYAILNFTPIVFFSCQLQKNGMALVWVFTYLYYGIRFLKLPDRKDAIKAMVAMLLCALTHFGSFGLLLFISFSIGVFNLILNKRRPGFLLSKYFWLAVGCCIGSIGLIAYFDSIRFFRMIQAPLKLFEAPVVLFALHGQNYVLHGSVLLTVVVTNLLTISGLYLLVKHRKGIEDYKYVLGLACACCALLLSCPFLGLEWAKRLFMLAFVPLIILSAVVINSLVSKWYKRFFISLSGGLLLLSLASALLEKPFLSISYEALEEFELLNQKISLTPNDAVVCRQDLRLLASWAFQTKGVQDYLITKQEFSKYDALFCIVQRKGKNPGLLQQEGKEGEHLDKVYAGDYFEVYKLMDNSGLPEEPGKIFKGIRGVIMSKNEDIIVVKDFKSGYLRKVDVEDIVQESELFTLGMAVEINGQWTPFSLTIRAETIREIEEPS